ncbi:hypothetical protein [Sandaracinus amylolyticus]|uniref:Uncharacterized protein n=1 Tax=Sandaracinus amylolyticus TaxID=927083 RepID=A0A0F6YH34_9BACT|nr:hypothetical protein [Sandaracinus amylolyticus]AKF04385.1 hypothetical protein DB32_001534 [Sandaracinus amylolyticus]
MLRVVVLGASSLAEVCARAIAEARSGWDVVQVRDEARDAGPRRPADVALAAIELRDEAAADALLARAPAWIAGIQQRGGGRLVLVLAAPHHALAAVRARAATLRSTLRAVRVAVHTLVLLTSEWIDTAITERIGRLIVLLTDGQLEEITVRGSR